MRINHEMFERALEVTPNGTQTLSKAPSRYVEGVYPKIIKSAQGCWIKDVDDNTYVDYIAALGPIILGYADERVDSAVKAQIDRGVLFSFPSELEAQVAERLNCLGPTQEMWKFTKTGSDACSMAVKTARAYTKRENIVVCGYHGWHDWYSIVNDKKDGIPVVMSGLVRKAKYNDIESFRQLIDRNTAAVMMEPMVFEHPLPGFLEAVAELCHKNGALFILDETVTGFRYPGYLAQNFYNVRPDLTVVGKAMANGYPMAAFGGPREIMDTCTKDNFFCSTTFGGDCVGLAAAKAVFETLSWVYDASYETGKELQTHFNGVFDGKAVCKGFPTRTMFEFPSLEHKALFWQECCKRGVVFGYSNFIMDAHTSKEIRGFTKSVVSEAGKFVLDNWSNPSAKMEGKLPVEVFRLLRS